MKPGYLDADVILRYLTGDPADMAEIATELLEQAELQAGKTLILAEITVAEVVWVLQRFYKFEKSRIARGLLTFMELPGLQVVFKVKLQQALHIYHTHNVGFGDALLSAQALSEGPATVYAFDHDYKKIPGLLAIDPRTVAP